MTRGMIAWAIPQHFSPTLLCLLNGQGMKNKRIPRAWQHIIGTRLVVNTTSSPPPLSSSSHLLPFSSSALRSSLHGVTVQLHHRRSTCHGLPPTQDTDHAAASSVHTDPPGHRKGKQHPPFHSSIVWNHD